LKEESLDLTVWTAGCGTGKGPGVRQNVGWWICW